MYRCMCTCLFIYILLQRESWRERERGGRWELEIEIEHVSTMIVCVKMCVYIYIGCDLHKMHTETHDYTDVDEDKCTEIDMGERERGREGDECMYVLLSPLPSSRACPSPSGGAGAGFRVVNRRSCTPRTCTWPRGTASSRCWCTGRRSETDLRPPEQGGTVPQQPPIRRASMMRISSPSRN